MKETYGNMSKLIKTSVCMFACTGVCIGEIEMDRAREKDKHTCKLECVWMSVCFCISERNRHMEMIAHESEHVCVFACTFVCICQTEPEKHSSICVSVCSSVCFCVSE